LVSSFFSFNSQSLVLFLASSSLEAASKNLAIEESGDIIDPTNLQSKVSLEGIEAITFVSSSHFIFHSNIEAAQVIFCT